MRKSKKSKKSKAKKVTLSLYAEVQGKEFELEIPGRVSTTGKTLVFKIDKEYYLEHGIGGNLWVNIDELRV